MVEKSWGDGNCWQGTRLPGMSWATRGRMLAGRLLSYWLSPLLPSASIATCLFLHFPCWPAPLPQWCLESQWLNTLGSCTHLPSPSSTVQPCLCLKLSLKWSTLTTKQDTAFHPGWPDMQRSSTEEGWFLASLVCECNSRGAFLQFSDVQAGTEGGFFLEQRWV